MVNTKPKLDIKPINDQAPIKEDINAPPVRLSDTITLTKNDAAAIIEYLCALSGYQVTFVGTQSANVNKMTQQLVNQVYPK